MNTVLSPLLCAILCQYHPYCVYLCIYTVSLLQLFCVIFNHVVRMLSVMSLLPHCVLKVADHMGHGGTMCCTDGPFQSLQCSVRMEEHIHCLSFGSI